jgi:hypothetical protein
VTLALDHRLISMTFKATTKRVPSADTLVSLGYEIVREDVFQILAKLTRNPDTKLYVLKTKAKIMFYSKGTKTSVREEASRLL